MQDISNEEIGRRIKEVREEKQLSVRKLAEMVGIHESNMGRYEKGEVKNININNIKNIAKALGVNPMWIIGKADDKKETKYTLEDAYFNFAKEMQDNNVSVDDMKKLWDFYSSIKNK